MQLKTSSYAEKQLGNVKNTKRHQRIANPASGRTKKNSSKNDNKSLKHLNKRRPPRGNYKSNPNRYTRRKKKKPRAHQTCPATPRTSNVTNTHKYEEG